MVTKSEGFSLFHDLDPRHEATHQFFISKNIPQSVVALTIASSTMSLLLYFLKPL